MRFIVNLYSKVCLNAKELLARGRRHIWSLSDCNRIQTHRKKMNPHSKMNTQLFGQAGQMIELCCEYLSIQCIWLHIISMSCTRFRVNVDSIACLNVKELLARGRRHIWSLSDCNGILTHNHLVCKQTLKHLAKLTKWLSCVVSTYLYSTFDCMLLSCHVRGSEWIYTL